MLCLASTALAETVELTKYNGTYPAGSFDGSDGVGVETPTFPNNSLQRLDIDVSNGTLLAADSGFPQRIYKFDEAGESTAFSGLEGKTIISPQSFGSYGDLEIDNSGTASQGHFYAFPEFGPINAYLPSGKPLEGASFPISGTGDVCGAAVAPNGHFWRNQYNSGIFEYDANGVATGTTLNPQPGNFCDFDMDSQGNIYTLAPYYAGELRKYSPTGELIGLIDSGPVNAIAIDHSNDDVYVDTGSLVKHYSAAGGLLDTFGMPDEPSYPGLSNSRGLAVSPTTHTVYVANNRNPTTIDTFSPTGEITIPTVATTVPDVDAESAVLRGTVDPDGIDTTDCEFEWGTSSAYGHTEECAEGKIFSGSSGVNDVSLAISGLTKGATYHFRITATNENGVISKGADREFTASGAPLVEAGVSRLNTDGVQFDVTIDPNGGVTRYHVEYGTEAGVYPEVVPVPDQALESNLAPESFSHVLTGLKADTVYHYRVVAHNDAGVTNGPDQTFKTFPPPPANDPCENALVRKQTGAALVPDCRAYELVSAANQEGYDVESDLISGYAPLDAYPGANERVLYSMRFGALAVPGSPTNFGHDPYVASRGSDGWSTEYVGLPADGMPSEDPYGSPLAGSDGNLNEFAFAGEKICDPCFSDGSTNVPLRKGDGSIVKGMAGGSNPAADPVGEVRKRFSEDGSSFVFASDQVFAAGASSGSMWVYERDLASNSTQLVSTLPNGSPIGGEVAALDVSRNGDRVLVGRVVDEDEAGNRYYDLYMHVGNSASSVAIADTAGGVLYDGMTADGSKVFFTTRDQIAGTGDSDESADLYRADVGTSGPASVARVSTGSEGSGNNDLCEPVTNWNVVSGGPDCSVVALAGGSGVAADDGTVFFVSPEKLDGAANGAQNQPNLYVARPGQSPHFVATIDSSAVKPGPKKPEHPVVDTNFGANFAKPEGLAVDQATGDVYVAENETGKVHRFKPNGEPDDFSAGPDADTNTITGFEWAIEGTAGVAVDNSGGPSDGNFYVESSECCFVAQVDVYSSSGEHLGQLDGSGDDKGEFGLICGIAVDQSDGSIYLGDYFGDVWRYTPSGATVTEGDYSGAISTGAFSGSCAVAATGGKVYVGHQEGERAVDVYPTSAFVTGTPPEPTPETIAEGVTGLSTDPATGDVYLDEGTKVAVLDSSGESLATIGGGGLSTSASLAVRSSNKHLFANSGGSKVYEYGYVVPPYLPIDNPAVVHGVKQAGVHSYGDFQITPDGSYAVFASLMPLTAAVNHGHYEIYRYDTGADQLECVSCGPSNASDVMLDGHGLNIADSGKVFFTTDEQFVLRDTNQKKDVYEYSGGNPQIISLGTGPADSGLLSTSESGRDVYFFTRDSLAPQDENGSLMKIYDAREGGGFLYTRDLRPCAASDECHGPGTVTPPPPAINTFRGSGRPVEQEKDCSGKFGRFHKLMRRSRRLNHKAARVRSRKAKHKLHKRAHRLHRKGRKVRRNAKACAKSNGGEGK